MIVVCCLAVTAGELLEKPFSQKKSIVVPVNHEIRLQDLKANKDKVIFILFKI